MSQLEVEKLFSDYHTETKVLLLLEDTKFAHKQHFTIWKTSSSHHCREGLRVNSLSVDDSQLDL